MIIISILLVPFFVLILLSVVFVIGVSGSTSPRYDNRRDNSLNQSEKLIPPGQLLPPV